MSVYIYICYINKDQVSSPPPLAHPGPSPLSLFQEDFQKSIIIILYFSKLICLIESFPRASVISPRSFASLVTSSPLASFDSLVTLAPMVDNRRLDLLSVPLDLRSVPLDLRSAPLVLLSAPLTDFVLPFSFLTAPLKIIRLIKIFLVNNGKNQQF